MVFRMLSTESLIAPETERHEYAAMPNRSFETVSDRLDYVIEVCRFPSQTALANVLGEKPQNLTNWRTRNTIGRAGKKLRAVTGVSTDWMESAVGEPFPDGPVIYSPEAQAERSALTISRLEGDIDQLRYTLLALVDWLSDSTPGAASGIRDRLRAAHPEYSKRGFQSRLLTVLNDLAATEEATRKRPLPPAARGSSGRKRAS